MDMTHNKCEICNHELSNDDILGLCHDCYNNIADQELEREDEKRHEEMHRRYQEAYEKGET